MCALFGGDKKRLDFLVSVGLLLGEFGDLHPVYLLHLKRTLLADNQLFDTVMAFGDAFQLQWSVKQDMGDRLIGSYESFEAKVLTLKSMWAEAKELNPRRYERVVNRLPDSEKLVRNLEKLKAAWTFGETVGTPNGEVLLVMAVYRRLLDDSSVQHDSGPHQ